MMASEEKVSAVKTEPGDAEPMEESAIEKLEEEDSKVNSHPLVKHFDDVKSEENISDLTESDKKQSDEVIQEDATLIPDNQTMQPDISEKENVKSDEMEIECPVIVKQGT